VPFGAFYLYRGYSQCHITLERKKGEIMLLTSLGRKVAEIGEEMPTTTNTGFGVFLDEQNPTDQETTKDFIDDTSPKAPKIMKNKRQTEIDGEPLLLDKLVALSDELTHFLEELSEGSTGEKIEEEIAQQYKKFPRPNWR
jgi:hypothetical protein